MGKKKDKLYLKGLGFTLLREKHHYVWGCPCGKHILITAKSRTDRTRGFKNMQSDIRKLGCVNI